MIIIIANVKSRLFKITQQLCQRKDPHDVELTVLNIIVIEIFDKVSSAIFHLPMPGCCHLRTHSLSLKNTYVCSFSAASFVSYLFRCS